MDYHFAIAKIELSFLLSRYSELLKDDFPRIPFFNDYELFLKACQLGKDMIDLHLLKNKLTSKMRFVVSGDNVVSKIKHDTNRVLINETQYFEGISEEVWDFRIGSYK